MKRGAQGADTLSDTANAIAKESRDGEFPKALEAWNFRRTREGKIPPCRRTRAVPLFFSETTNSPGAVYVHSTVWI